jgi:hypothetical protein
VAPDPKEKRWEPPKKSDQPPGEESVQVNDAYVGGQPPPEVEPNLEEQHPTGG